ncbi:MAG: flagellar protein FlaG [Candidatus Tectimicrobiota bacterium]
MEDGISNPGIPLQRDFVPISSSSGPGARESHVTSQRVSTPVSGAQPAATSLPVEPNSPTATARTADDKITQGVTDSVAFANAIAAFLDTKVSFTYDERIAQIVVKVTRGDSEEVIRQIPAEEMIKLAVQLRNDFRGLIFNRTG